MNIESLAVTIDNCPDLLTVNEVAQILRISDKTAYSLVRSGKIKSFVISNRIYRILKTDLLTFIMAGCCEHAKKACIFKGNHDFHHV